MRRVRYDVNPNAWMENKFRYTVENGAAVVLGWFGNASRVRIPRTLGGLPVREIRSLCDPDHSSLRVVHVPDTVRRLEARSLMLPDDAVVFLHPGPIGWPDDLTGGRHVFFSAEPGTLTHDMLTGAGMPLHEGCCIPFIPGDYGQCRSGAWRFRITPDGVCITDYLGHEEELIIPHELAGRPVTEIGDHAFCGCDDVETLLVPSTVRRIGMGAFAFCTELTQVMLPDDLQQLGDYAFCGCEALEEIDIPPALRCIPEGAFQGCFSLKEIWMEDGLEEIGPRAFRFCRRLRRLWLPAHLRLIASEAFDCCALLREIRGLEHVPDIADGAFSYSICLQVRDLPPALDARRSLIFPHCPLAGSVPLHPARD